MGTVQGKRNRPYQTVIDIADSTGPAYTCSCPSRKFRASTRLDLLLLWRRGRFGTARAGAGLGASGDKGGDESERRERGRRAGGIWDGVTGPSEAARRRARRRAERITAGAAELEQRVGGSAAGRPRVGRAGGVRDVEGDGGRMVDAQAPGLAARVRELGATSSSGPGWPVRLLEECALLHLLDQGWLRRGQRLPDDLAAHGSLAGGAARVRRTGHRCGTAGGPRPVLHGGHPAHGTRRIWS